MYKRIFMYRWVKWVDPLGSGETNDKHIICINSSNRNLIWTTTMRMWNARYKWVSFEKYTLLFSTVSYNNYNDQLWNKHVYWLDTNFENVFKRIIRMYLNNQLFTVFNTCYNDKRKIKQWTKNYFSLFHQTPSWKTYYLQLNHFRTKQCYDL